MSQIVVKSLCKSFGSQKVLNGIDLSIDKGETLAVLGRSGTGKSVLLKLLVGLQTPDSGSIIVDGQEINGLALKQLNEVRKKIGFLFQQAALYDSLTVGENVAFPLARHMKLSAPEQESKVKELLSEVGMEHDLDKLPSELSGGMRKRVGLARALALDPEILLFDEPTSGLDPITAGEIEELIVKLQEQRRRTALVVTHDVGRAKNYSHRLVLLHEGRIRAQGTLEELQRSGDPFVARFVGQEQEHRELQEAL
ncbi:MAG TPA: ATP-binding cassette domain-containing protein [Bryobacteraceae bacterium]|nr:ATP-binding cassette domain-containing protein [Bryobacteraceae bacterium]